MNLFDIFEGAIDDLEARRIEDLNAKMDDLTARAKESTDPKYKEAMRHEYARAKAERDSYYKINVDEAPGAETLAHNQATDAGNLQALGLAEAGKTMDPDEVGYMLSKATIQKIVNNAFAQKLPDVTPIVKTLDADNGAYSITTSDDMFNLELSVIGQLGDIGVFVENAYNSYKGSGVVTDIIRGCYTAAERQWGTPQTRTLQPVQDTGHGVWQAMADKLGVTYEAGAKTTDTSAAAPTGKSKYGDGAKVEGTPPKEGDTKTAIIINSAGLEWAPMDITAEQGQEYLTGMDTPITLRWVDGTEKPTDIVKEHGGGGGGPAQWHSYVRAHRANEDEIDEHGGGVNGMKNYISWRKKANTERGITKAPPPVGKSAPSKLPTIPKGTVHSKLDQSRGVVPKASFDEGISEGAKSVFRNRVEQQQGNVLDQIKNSNYSEAVKTYLYNIHHPASNVFKAGYRSYRKGQEEKEKLKDLIVQKYNIDPSELKNAELDLMANNLEEGWSDKHNPVPYGVYIDGKQWKEFPTDDHARAVANKLEAKLKAEGRPGKVTFAPSQAYMDSLKEAGSPAQQAAIAINMKKHHQKPKHTDEASMNWAAHKSTGPKFSGYLKGTDPAPTEYGNKSFGAEAKENPMGAKELEYLIAKAKEMTHTPDPELHHGDEHEINSDEFEVEEGIQGNMTVKSAPITHPLRQRNFVAKNAIQSGAGKHANQLKKAAAAGRHAKHKGQPLDISEGDNFLTWAVRNGYNLTKPAVYESARQTYNTLLEDCGPIAPHKTYYGAMDEDLKQGEFYVWTVYFDDGSSKRIKVTSDEFDPYEYYAKEKKNVVNVDYNWNKHQ